jgi:soluble lytic murein transglycosylase-like protein
MSKKHWSEQDTFNLAQKWGPIFGAPPATIMSIVTIESDHNPNKVNPARSEKGGAWGLGQQMLDEAADKVLRIVHAYGKDYPEVKKAAKLWKGSPNDLLNPDLNLMITSWQLGKLHQEFGDFPTVAAAYHQGAGAVRQRLRHGLPPVTPKYQPLGVSYVKQAMNAMYRYEAPFLIPAVYTVRG